MLRTKKAPSFQTGNYTGGPCYCQPRNSQGARRSRRLAQFDDPELLSTVLSNRYRDNIGLTFFLHADKKRDDFCHDLVGFQRQDLASVWFSPLCGLVFQMLRA